MGKIIAITICSVLMLSLCSCGAIDSEKSTNNTIESSSEEFTGTGSEQSQTKIENDTSEDLIIEDMSALDGLGEIEVSEGVVYVDITVPASLVNGLTQKDVDDGAGEYYQSVKINEDGSATYRMTRKQHDAMLENLKSSLEESCNEMLSDQETFGITAIEHNDNFTAFKVTLNSNEVSIVTSISVIAFYMYGGLYGIFSGSKADNISVEYYSPDGSLIQTANPSEFGY